MLVAQEQRLCTVGGGKNGKTTPFKCPLQKVSKIEIVLDQQNAGRWLSNYCAG
jgi:hypothetical protein